MGWVLTGFAQAADSRPNIIVIYSDDHGHADLGVQGVAQDIKRPTSMRSPVAVLSLETAIALLLSAYHLVVD